MVPDRKATHHCGGHVNLTLDYGSRARLGVLLPSGNAASECQFTAYAPPGLSIHYTRLRLTGSTEAELMGMADGIETAAQLLNDVKVQLIAFHCTAVSTWAPELEKEILSRIRDATRLPATATSEALMAALEALRARRMVMLSPYLPLIADREELYFKNCGFEILASRNLGVSTPEEMLAITPDTWLRELENLHHEKADVYVVSCTATRAMEIVSEAEVLLGKPVLTSNSAMLWHACRLLGITDQQASWGQIAFRA